MITRIFSILRMLPRALTTRARAASLRRRQSLRVHLGCGDDRLPDFVNLDCRLTVAADAVIDLNKPRFGPQSLAFAFSHAFFEHLFRSERIAHLQGIFDALEPAGVCCYIGIPYFRNIAKFYLERGPGTAGPVFDLYNVYRYSHGDPEQVPSWWLAQLHKSLFDEEELSLVLQTAGFRSFVLFCYGFPGDVHELPVSMGFYASRDHRPGEQLQSEVLSFLARFADQKVRMSTLEWINNRF